MGYTRRQKGRGRSRNEILFPKKSGVDYDKLQMTPEGEYSVTRRRDGERLIQFIRETVKGLKSKTITDMTGNVGGDTILFGMNFKHVVSYELKEENFRALENNVGVYGLKNVELRLGDSLRAVPDIDTDVVYIDAPWGGPEYKDKKDLDLYLGRKRIDELARVILEDSDYLFMKVPANYNFKRLDDTGLKWTKFKIRSFYVVCLFPKNE